MKLMDKIWNNERVCILQIYSKFSNFPQNGLEIYLHLSTNLLKYIIKRNEGG